MDREDSSRYVNQPTEPSPAYEPQPRKRSKAPLILGLLLVLALVGVGVLGWLWQQESTKASAAQAGLEAVEGKLKRLMDEADKLNKAAAKDDESEKSASSTSDELVETTLQFVKARTYFDGATLDGIVQKQTDEFASVTVSSSKGTGATAYYLKKVDGAWVVIGDSSETEMLEEDYGLPQNF